MWEPESIRRVRRVAGKSTRLAFARVLEIPRHSVALGEDTTPDTIGRRIDQVEEVLDSLR